jgi:hypothetical protein
MRLYGTAAAGVAALAAVLGFCVPVRAQVADEMRFDFTLSIGSTAIADFQDEFQATGPAAGWGYLYNGNGALGNPANYVPLTLNGGQYTGPSGILAVGRNATIDPVAYPPNPVILAPVPTTFVRPGLGSLQDPAGIERAAIIAYTIQASDLAAAGVTGPANVAITAYDFAVSTLATPDGMSARVYGGNNPTPLLNFSDDTLFPFPPGFRFETMLDPDPIPLGNFNVGDTIYFAIGANSLSVVPEPAALSTLAMGTLLLVRRRRRS